MNGDEAREELVIDRERYRDLPGWSAPAVDDDDDDGNSSIEGGGGGRNRAKYGAISHGYVAGAGGDEENAATTKATGGKGDDAAFVPSFDVPDDMTTVSTQALSFCPLCHAL